MTAKIFELRDKMTFKPVLAVKLNPANEQERYLLARVGYGRLAEHQSIFVVLMGLTGDGVWNSDSHHWGDRTMGAAHVHINQHFDELDHGAVIDVEYLLQETSEPKRSESETVPC